MDSTDTPSAQRGRKVTNALLAVIAALMGIYFLKMAYFVLVPLLLGFFLAVLVRPVQVWLCWRLPGRLGALATAGAATVVVLVLALGVGLVYTAVTVVIGDTGPYIRELSASWQRLIDWANGHGIPIRADIIEIPGIRDTLLGWLKALLTGAWLWLGLLALAFFYLVLMLLEVASWRGKSQHALAGAVNAAVVDTFELVARKLRRYMLIRTGVSLFSGVAEGLWLWAMGVDFAFVWGLLFFLLNYIPNVGSLVAAVFPITVSLLQHGFWWTLLVGLGLLTLEQVIGNFIAPKLQGRGLSVSPVVLLWAVVFWSWMWGVAGAILAVPLTVILIITCAHVPPLRPIAMMLSRSWQDGDGVSPADASAGDEDPPAAARDG
jgi:AI-2 transport protein TqsA